MFESYLAPAAAVCAAVLFSLMLWASAAVAQTPAPRARYADGAIVKRGDTGATVKKVQRALGLDAAGVDLAMPIGTPVRAAACGVVEQAGVESGYGKIVCIRHTSAFVTCYAHLSEIARGVGSVIAQGQVIGRVGMTGHTTGPHLHFE